MRRRFKVMVEGKVYEVEVEEILNENIENTPINYNIQKTFNNMPSPQSKNVNNQVLENKDMAIVKAPLPGKIIKIIKNKGQEVQKGEAILLIEAMKMESEILAPKSGIIRDILILEGNIVNTGDHLVIID